MTDTRYVYGAGCLWHGPISAVAVRGKHNTPCCPHCGGMLFELESPTRWWSQVDSYENTGHPGYRKFIEWLQTHHYPMGQLHEALATYNAETGNNVRIGD